VQALRCQRQQHRQPEHVFADRYCDGHVKARSGSLHNYPQFAGEPMYHWDEWDWTHDEDERSGPFDHPFWMDRRHVDLLYEILMTHHFTRVLEIGCWHGSSTSAFVQAINDGCTFDFHVCDIDFTPQLDRVLACCSREVVRHEKDSLFVINPTYDLICVDGNHHIHHVFREVELLLRCRTPTIVAHDTGQVNVDPGCDGAVYLGKTFKSHPEYHWIEDCEERPGEFTNRGFFFCTKDRQLYEMVQPLFRTGDLTWNVSLFR
jgi:SAM-dependent methyltransferase